MSAVNNVMPATAKAETSLALSLAKTRDSLTEISPLLKQVKDVLDSNVLKTRSDLKRSPRVHSSDDGPMV